MNDAIVAALRGALFTVISVLGKERAREIVNECFSLSDKDHWGR